MIHLTFLLGIVFSYISLAIPIIEVRPSLNQNTWSQVKVGKWLIELYSPYCPHCIAFGPTWQQLYDQRASSDEINQFFMGQVNCAENGDLCSSQGVTHYPSLFLYDGRVLLDKYEGTRDIKSLGEYIDQHMDKLAIPLSEDLKVEVLVVESPSPKSNLFVHVLEKEYLVNLKGGKAGGASFVKYYAPWQVRCQHCKSLAPMWSELAASYETVDFYDMDCTDSRNVKSCEIEKIRGYPTLIFYHQGSRIEFSGSRKFDEIAGFVEKVLELSAISSVDNYAELEKVIHLHNVVILFLHTKNTTQEFASEISKSLLGTTAYVTSTSTELFSLFTTDEEPVYIVFKDHSATPSCSYLLPPGTEPHRYHNLITWLNSAKLPTLVELSASTYSDVMLPEMRSHLVVLTLLNPSSQDFEELKLQFKELALKWQVRNSKKTSARNVVFVWVNSEQWSNWLHSMYVLPYTPNGIHGSVLLVDPYGLYYWASNLDGKPLSVNDESVYNLIENGIEKGTVAPLSSRNIIERMATDLFRSSSLHFKFESWWLVVLLMVLFGLWRLRQVKQISALPEEFQQLTKIE